ncbi:MAG: flagellar hook-associated protein FlgK [Pseudomonadota bacterium]
MNLDVASNIARQSLIASQFQIALSSRNVAAADDPTRSRAAATLATTIDGGVRIGGVRRAEDTAVYTRMIDATSVTAERDAVLQHLNVLSELVGDPENNTSIGAMIGEMNSALVDYANAPDDPLFGRTVIERARDVADKLNRTSSELLLLRDTADSRIAGGVDSVNQLLLSLDEINKNIVKGTISGRDVTMDLDRRDGIVAQISEYIGVKTLSRSNNDIALFTDSGVTMYDNGVREVSFARTTVFTATTAAGEVFVDGLPITGASAPMPAKAGSIVGSASVRDYIIPTYQLQMDEIAREITDIFTDGVGSLFLNGGGPDYAGTISVSATVDPTQGGTVENLRDGTGNLSGFAGYSDRLLSLSDALAGTSAFDPNTELNATSSLLDFSAETAGWIENLRKSTNDDVNAEAAILRQSSDTLSRATGVNLDDEYAQQLMIERSFSASSKIISIVDEMFDTLLRIN